MTNDEENSDNDDVSVARDDDVSVASTRSGRSIEKGGWSELQNFHTQSKSEISEDSYGDGVIILDNGSTTSLFEDKSMVKNLRN